MEVSGRHSSQTNGVGKIETYFLGVGSKGVAPDLVKVVPRLHTEQLVVEGLAVVPGILSGLGFIHQHNVRPHAQVGQVSIAAVVRGQLLAQGADGGAVVDLSELIIGPSAESR